MARAYSIVGEPEGQASPFSQVRVTLTKREHVELLWEARYWKSEHRRAAERALNIEAALRKQLRQAAQQAEQREAGWRGELEAARARIRDLEQRLFGRKSERRWVIDDQRRVLGRARRPRGQQRGAPGHGRRRLEHLPVRTEVVELDSPHCPVCGLPLSRLPGSDECEVIEVEVRAYRRRIRRPRYRRSCDCAEVPGIVSAAPPARLIARGKFGVSVWVSVLLDKFLYGRPSQRLVQDLADHGVELPLGTLCGGLQAIAPLFAPLPQVLLGKLRGEPHWHADETRWEVFAEIDGRRGHRWYLWVFESRSVVYYVLDESRSSSVPAAVLCGVKRGIISCDRHPAYKKFARLHPGIGLSFCWAHQRRDLLQLANDYPQLSAWAMAWVERIGELFALHAQRREAPRRGRRYAELDRRVRSLIAQMADQREAALAAPSLPPAARKVLQSMGAHWTGLTAFLERPELPLDNNAAERALRTPVVGRKNYYGSGSLWSGQLAATMFSVLMTLRRWQINPRTWLSAYLQACADHGNRAPPQLRCFVPWTMERAQLAAMRATLGSAARRHRCVVLDSS